MASSNNKFIGKNWVDVASVTKPELQYFLKRSTEMKTALKERQVKQYQLAASRDLFAALLFYEPSTRTRFSFEIGALRLGLKTVGFSGTEATSVKKGESLLDTIDMFDAYDMDAVILRHPLDGAARAVTENLSRDQGPPLCCFNGGDGKNEHPTQGLLDVFTIYECCGRLENLEIGIAVDPKYGRTTHSFPVLMSLFPGNRFHIFSHPDLRMPTAVIRYLRSRGVEVEEHFDSGDQLREKLPALDFLYMTRLQRERFEDEAEYYQARDMFLYTLDMMELTKENFGLGHPLPDDKANPSIHPTVKRHPKYWCKRQAGNGVPTRMLEMALSLGLVGEDFDGELFQAAEVDQAFYAERDIAAHAAERKKQEGPKDIRPLEDGTVIDHVEGNPYAINKIGRLLGVRARGNIFRSGVVEAIGRPGVTKGVLMIKQRHLDDDEARLIAALAPGATINDITAGKVVRKRDLYLPAMLEGMADMRCTNTRCITRSEYSEHVPPKAARLDGPKENGNIVKCCYCNNLMESHELF